MRNVIRYKYTPRKIHASGGAELAMAATPLVDPLMDKAFGNMATDDASDADGIDNKKSMWKSALSGAGKGALAGTMLGPWGTIGGAALGFATGIFTGKKKAKQADEMAAAQQAAEAEQAAQEAEMKRQYEEQQKAIAAQKQDAYNKAYYAANPINEGASLMGAYGVDLATGGNIVAKNGTFQPLATGVSKAIGNKHEQGGIDLAVNGKEFAEIEGDEVVKGTKVYSDRKEIGGDTYAAQAEKLAKEKSKWEAKLKSGSNLERNTALKSIENIDKDLEKLFAIQEASKTPEEKVAQGNMAFDGQDLAQVAQLAAPFIDNVFNAKMIKETPELPGVYAPTMRKAEDAVAMPMKTQFNVNPQLAEIQSGYKAFNKDVTENTASSGVARANKMAAFSKTLSEKNRVFGEKENIETRLQNENLRNIQEVSARNVANAQNIQNSNLALMDDYSARKEQRALQNSMRLDNMNRNRMQNVANLTDDITTGIKDWNMRESDLEKIKINLMNTDDASGIASMMGTNTFDEVIKDPKTYQKFYDILEKSPNKAAFEEYKKKYGKNKKK